MEFCLHYDGKLKSNDNAAGKHRIRTELHKQIKAICTDTKFSLVFTGDINGTRKEREKPLYIEHSEKRFWFLISEHLSTVVDLDICLLLPHNVGSIVKNGGDIDNRIKTLFDALRVPSVTSEIPSSDSFDYATGGMYCLLQDDKLINKVSIQSFRDFDPPDQDSVRCTIKVTTKITAALWGNLHFV
jgi:hypothetical protein